MNMEVEEEKAEEEVEELVIGSESMQGIRTRNRTYALICVNLSKIAHVDNLRHVSSLISSNKTSYPHQQQRELVLRTGSAGSVIEPPLRWIDLSHACSLLHITVNNAFN